MGSSPMTSPVRVSRGKRPMPPPRVPLAVQDSPNIPLGRASPPHDITTKISDHAGPSPSNSERRLLLTDALQDLERELDRNAVKPVSQNARPGIFSGFSLCLLGDASCDAVRKAVESAHGTVADSSDADFIIIRLARCVTVLIVFSVF